MKCIEDIEGLTIISNSLDGIIGLIKLPDSGKASVVASWGGGWDHVSVAPRKTYNIPTWADMCYIKDLFFKEEEVVIQIHPAKSTYVNLKENCLHLWRPQYKEIPTPPILYV